jgi:RNA polymerase sigma-70 factor (ECF subfamily)
MSDQIDLTQLAKRAQQGDKGAFDRLAELAAVRLRLYVFRLTLQEDLAEEIVQETLLEMVKILGKLKKTDRFWPWLYGIATNKLRHHYRSELVHRKVAPLGPEEAEALSDREEGVENLVTQEIKQIVANAVKSLKTSHRAVLIMRCYDNMSYAEIAQSMGCTEFGTRMLFLRAKKALEKQLARSGLKKGSLLGALLVFGKMTAPTEVAAAQVAVTAVTLDVGLAAGLAGLATGKAALVSLAAVGMVGVGTVVKPDWIDRQPVGQAVSAAPLLANVLGTQVIQAEKHTYFLPEGPYGPLMLRAQADQGDWIVLQNAVANYTFDGRTLEINNHRCWASDLGVVRLPTDPPAMKEFLSRVEGLPRMLPSTRASGKGLLVEVDYDRAAGTSRLEVLRNPNVSDEDYFQSNWPLNVHQQDNRDLMHRRGWTLFRIDGQLHGRVVSGEGRLSFVYQSYQRSRPWLRLKTGDLTIQDSLDSGASVTRQGDGHFAVYRGGSFFKGLARPWAGFHTVDLVRRDAAEQEVWFRTLPGPQPQGKVQVELDLPSSLLAVYTIDLEADVVDQIEFAREGKTIGKLVFTYLQDISGLRQQFLAPTNRITQGPQAQDMGLLWLAGLVDDSLGQ